MEHPQLVTTVKLESDRAYSLNFYEMVNYTTGYETTDAVFNLVNKTMIYIDQIDYMTVSNYYLVIICRYCNYRRGHLQIFSHNNSYLEFVHEFYGLNYSVNVSNYAHIHEGKT